MNAANVESLIAEYQRAATRHGSAKTSQAANAAAEKLASIYREIRERNEQSKLLPLLEDANSSIRCWAAAHALEFAPDAAVDVLEALAHGAPGPLRANASMTLREWRAGRLTFP